MPLTIQQTQSTLANLESQSEANHRALEEAQRIGSPSLIAAANLKLSQAQSTLDSTRSEVPTTYLTSKLSHPSGGKIAVTSKNIQV